MQLKRRNVQRHPPFFNVTSVNRLTMECEITLHIKNLIAHLLTNLLIQSLAIQRGKTNRTQRTN